MREAGTYEAVQVGDMEDVQSQIRKVDGVRGTPGTLHPNFHGCPPAWEYWMDEATHRGLGAQERQP